MPRQISVFECLSLRSQSERHPHRLEKHPVFSRSSAKHSKTLP